MPISLYIILNLALVALCIKPLGKYIALVFMGRNTFADKLLSPIERAIYKICAINPGKEMNWREYASAMVMIGFLGFILLYLILSFQNFLPLNPQNFSGLSSDLAFNTAIGFITNGNWQSYAGETTISHFSQIAGLSVQNFVSTATGLAIFAALARGFARKQAKTIGNFYSDLVRGIIYIMLPLSIIFAIFLSSQGVMQNLSAYVEYTPIETSEQTAAEHHLIPQGAVASQVAVKTLGSSGGGYFAVNSAHPFDNPTPLTNFLQILAVLLLPMTLPYSFGCIIGDRKQGWALAAAMFAIFLPSLIATVISEQQPNPLFDKNIIDSSAGNMEGKETRFGAGNCAYRIVVATATSNGSSNCMLDSFSPTGVIAPIVLTQFSEVIFGGIGSGMYNILSFLILTVFVGGLMVGRAPEYIGKKVTSYDIKMAAIVVIFPAVTVLFGAAIAVSTDAGKAGVLNSGAQAFTEIMYAYSSAGNNDGGTFAGLNTDSIFYNSSLAAAMFFSRYIVMIAALAIAGSFVTKNIAPRNSGTLPTHTPAFVFLLTWMLIIVGILTYVPAIVMGPVAEHFHLYGLATDNIAVTK